MILRYEDFPHYEDESWVENYANRNRRDLLIRRTRILNEFRQFSSDEEFITYLQEHAPHIYRRSLLELKALAVAESHKETPEEYRDRHERVAWADLENEIAAEVESIRQIVFREIKMDRLKKALEQEFPEEYREIIHQAFQRYQQGGRGDEQKPPPEIYGP